MKPTCESSGSRRPGAIVYSAIATPRPSIVIFDAVGIGRGDGIGFAAQARQHRAPRVEHCVRAPRDRGARGGASGSARMRWRIDVTLQRAAMEVSALAGRPRTNVRDSAVAPGLIAM